MTGWSIYTAGRPPQVEGGFAQTASSALALTCVLVLGSGVVRKIVNRLRGMEVTMTGVRMLVAAVCAGLSAVTAYGALGAESASVNPGLGFPS